MPLDRMVGRDVCDRVHDSITDEAFAFPFKKPYRGLVVRGPWRCAGMMHRFCCSGVVYTVGSLDMAREMVGSLCAPNKSSLQRLVVDTHVCNCWLGLPPEVSLAGGSASSALEAPGGSKFWVASADIADAFYNMELPSSWRPCFTLPPLLMW